MRIHEILDECIEYAALEGFLGCDVFSLIEHLSGINSTIDFTYFAYIYKLLVAHSCIEIILTTYPTKRRGGEVSNGTAPLPEGPDVDHIDVASLLQQGQIAQRIASDSNAARRTNRAAIKENRELRRQKLDAIEQDRAKHASKLRRGSERKATEPAIKEEEEEAEPSGAGKAGKTHEEFGDGLLFRRLDEDDDGQGGPAVKRDDLQGLLDKWGTRLRIRATDDEIYFRLVGSHQRTTRISGPVFLILQLAARARDPGISAIDLSASSGSSAGSVHYFMNVLMGLGLIGKVPYIQHSAQTSLAVYHKYLEKNSHYRAATRKFGDDVHDDANIDSITGLGKEVDGEVEEQNDPAVENPSNAMDWGFDFSPISEADLMTGPVVKERLIKLLDDPRLKNHLLKVWGLLPLLGWSSTAVLRHRRAVPRHIDALIQERVVEKLYIGEKAIPCLRLTKYNPDSQDRLDQDVVVDDRLLWLGDQSGDVELVSEHIKPFDRTDGGATMVRPLELQIHDLVIQSDRAGRTIAELSDSLHHFFRRSLEYFFNRAEENWAPPHLSHRDIKTTMDSYGRERRLKAYGRTSIRAILNDHNQSIDEVVHPPVAAEAGHWGDVSFRAFYADKTAWVKSVDQCAQKLDDETAANMFGTSNKGRPHGSKNKNQGVEGPENLESEDEENDNDDRPKRAFRYNSDIQKRGRPRKYIHVVNEDGKVDRSIIGHVFPHADLYPIYIYFASANRLVPGPDGYSGVRSPPPVTAEDIKKGRSPSFFDDYPGPATAKKKRKSKKTNGKEKKVGQGGTTVSKKRKFAKTQDSDGRPRREGLWKIPRKGAIVDHGSEVDELDHTDEEGNHRAGPSGSYRIEVTQEEQLGELPTENAESYNPDSAVNVSTQQAAGSLASTDAEYTASDIAIENGTDNQNMVLDDPRIPKQSHAPVPLFSPLTTDEQMDQATRKGKTPGEMQGSFAAVVPGMTDRPPTPISVSTKACASRSDLAPRDDSTRVTQIDGASHPTPHLPIASKKRKSTKAAESSSTHEASDQRRTSSKHKKTRKSVVFTEDSATGPSVRSTSRSPHAELGRSDPVTESRMELSRRASSLSKKASGSDIAVPLPKVQVLPARARSVSVALAERPPTTTEEGDIPMRDAGTPRTERETTPLVELPSQVAPLKTQNRGNRSSRPDMGMSRRLKEILRVLQENGGILADHKLRHAHSEWIERKFGTDDPDAPPTKALTDRYLARKIYAKLIADGRVKETTTSVPTLTGRWTQQKLYFLADKQWSDVQKYIRASETEMSRCFSGKNFPRTGTMEAEYSAVRVPIAKGLRPTGKIRGRYGPPKVSAQEEQNSTTEVDPLVRRETLLKDPSVAGNLNGYLVGRCCRLESLHKALINAVRECADSQSVVSTDPRVFAFPLLGSEIRLFEWFQIVATGLWTEDLDTFLHDSVKRETRLRDLPESLHLSRGMYAGYRPKQKFGGLLVTMAKLKIIAPLSTASEAEGHIVCQDVQTGARMFFKEAKDPAMATYFRLYEAAPVYHLAADIAGFLGVLPVTDEQQVEAFWAKMKKACLEVEYNSLPRMGANPLQSQKDGSSAPLSDALELDAETKKAMTQPSKWKQEPRLLPIQTAMVESAIDAATGEIRITEAEIEKLAWEYALPPVLLRERVDRQSEHQKSKVQMAETRTQVALDSRARQKERQARVDASLRAKIAERQAASKEEWEVRIVAAAQRCGLEVNDELRIFLGRQALLLMRIRGEVTDQAVDDSCRWFVRSKELRSIPSDSGGPLRTIFLRKAPVKKVKPAKRDRVKAVRDPSQRVSRRRRDWTHEDNETLLDCEVIIRARSRGTNSRGRSAMEQVFPDVGSQTFLTRLKKVLELPGKKAYFEYLEDAWYAIWMEHRSTEALPDDFPESITLFDLKAHLAFLRSHVHKADLRMRASAGIFPQKKERAPDLPPDVANLFVDNTWTYDEVAVHSFEQVWENTNANEQRLQHIALSALVEDSRIEGSRIEGDVTTRVGLRDGKLRAILKMIIGTPSHRYDPSGTTDLLRGYDSDHTLKMAQRMCDEKILKRVHGYAPAGMQYSYLASWLQQSEGPLIGEMQEDAIRMQARLEKDGEIDWSLTAAGGELAALMNGVSRGEVDINFDVHSFPTIMYETDHYNTRRLNDDAFEFDLKIARHQVGSAKRETDPPSIRERRDPTHWPTTPSLGKVGGAAKERVIAAIQIAGPDGLMKPEVWTAADCEYSILEAVLADLASDSPAEIFWAGYDEPRLIHSAFWDEHTVVTRAPIYSAEGSIVSFEDDSRLVLPRRWVDVYGERMDEDWTRCFGAALGWMIQRPGITERLLRAKVGHTLDRVELNEVLQYLLDSGKAERKVIVEWTGWVIPPVEVTGKDEDDLVGWWPITDGMWR